MEWLNKLEKETESIFLGITSFNPEFNVDGTLKRSSHFMRNNMIYAFRQCANIASIEWFDNNNITYIKGYHKHHNHPYVYEMKNYFFYDYDVSLILDDDVQFWINVYKNQKNKSYTFSNIHDLLTKITRCIDDTCNFIQPLKEHAINICRKQQKMIYISSVQHARIHRSMKK